MKVLYFNRQLGSFDGGASHASGMLAGLRNALGEQSVQVANTPQNVSYSHRSYWLKRSLGPVMDVPRVIRRAHLSRVEAAEVVGRVRSHGFDADVLLARSELHDTAPRRIADELGCKLVLEMNTPFEYELCDVQRRSFRPLVRWGERQLLSSADGIYVVSETLKTMLMESYDIPSDKFAVVPNGYSAELYQDLDDRAQIRDEVRRLLDVGDSFVVTFVGSLQDWHGVERLLQVAEQLRKRQVGDGRKAVVWVIGDGPRRDLIRRYAESNDSLRWHGSVNAEEMKRLLYASDLGIMPYDKLKRFYFSPLKMYDMIGSGLPFIGLDSGQIREVAEQYLSDLFLVASTEAGEYADRILALARRPEELQQISNEVAAARENLSWDARASLLRAYLQDLG